MAVARSQERTKDGLRPSGGRPAATGPPAQRAKPDGAAPERGKGQPQQQKDKERAPAARSAPPARGKRSPVAEEAAGKKKKPRLESAKPSARDDIREALRDAPLVRAPKKEGSRRKKEDAGETKFDALVEQYKSKVLGVARSAGKWYDA